MLFVELASSQSNENVARAKSQSRSHGTNLNFATQYSVSHYGSGAAGWLLVYPGQGRGWLSGGSRAGTVLAASQIGVCARRTPSNFDANLTFVGEGWPFDSRTVSWSPSWSDGEGATRDSPAVQKRPERGKLSLGSARPRAGKRRCWPEGRRTRVRRKAGTATAAPAWKCCQLWTCPCSPTTTSGQPLPLSFCRRSSVFAQILKCGRFLGR